MVSSSEAESRVITNRLISSPYSPTINMLHKVCSRFVLVFLWTDLQLETTAVSALVATTTTRKHKTAVLLGQAEVESTENVTRHKRQQCS